MPVFYVTPSEIVHFASCQLASKDCTVCCCGWIRFESVAGGSSAEEEVESSRLTLEDVLLKKRDPIGVDSIRKP
jgi:hypothetical protein